MTPDYCTPLGGWRVWHRVTADAQLVPDLAVRVHNYYCDYVYQRTLVQLGQMRCAACETSLDAPPMSPRPRVPWNDTSWGRFWPAMKPAKARCAYCERDCKPQMSNWIGLYGYKNPENVEMTSTLDVVIGECWLWGRVIEHELGWRAEFAYPRRLLVIALSLMPFRTNAWRHIGVRYNVPTRVIDAQYLRSMRLDHPLSSTIGWLRLMPEPAD